MAIVALILGIVSIFFGLVLGWTGFGSLIGVIAGIVGLILANIAKKDPEKAKLANAAFICSVIGVVLSAIFFVSCVACVGCSACLAA